MAGFYVCSTFLRALGDIPKNPVEVQLDFLNETYRVLKRVRAYTQVLKIGYRNFLGERDYSLEWWHRRNKEINEFIYCLNQNKLKSELP